MRSVTAGFLASLLCSGLVVAGCAPATTTQPTTRQQSTTATSPSVLAACVDVADKTGTLLTVVGRLATGDATVEQVQAAATAVSDSFDAAMAAVGPDTRAHLDEAGKALSRIEDALTTQPIDTVALRTAADDLFTALGDAAGVCNPSSTTSTQDTTTEDSVTTLSTS